MKFALLLDYLTIMSLYNAVDVQCACISGLAAGGQRDNCNAMNIMFSNEVGDVSAEGRTSLLSRAPTEELFEASADYAASAELVCGSQAQAHRSRGCIPFPLI
jgi:hypothetical protein